MELKYLFTYAYSALKGGEPISGSGSMLMSCTGADKITEKVIYGEKGAVKIATEAIAESGYLNVKLAPLGWFVIYEDPEKNDSMSREKLLGIIDAEAWAYCDYLRGVLGENSDYQRHVSALAGNIRERIIEETGGADEYD